MARTFTFLAAGALVFGATISASQMRAQNGAVTTQGKAQAQSDESAKPESVAPGTTIKAELSQSVDSKKAKPGDLVTAQITDAVKVDGTVVLPKGTKVMGKIVKSTARSKGDPDSVLAVRFDRADVKGKGEVPLPATLQALAADARANAVGPDDLQPAGNIEGGAAEAGAAGNRGVVGGVGSTVSGATSGAASTVPRTMEDQSGTVQSTVNGNANVTEKSAAAAANNSANSAETGLGRSGELQPTSRGVFGLNGITLNSNASSSSDGAVITSAGKNVHLESGTRLLLIAQASTSASAQR
jgi:hypothetical protein